MNWASMHSSPGLLARGLWELGHYRSPAREVIVIAEPLLCPGLRTASPSQDAHWAVGQTGGMTVEPTEDCSAYHKCPERPLRHSLFGSRLLSGDNALSSI